MSDALVKEADSPEEIDHRLFEFFLKQVEKGDKATLLARYLPTSKEGLRIAVQHFGIDLDHVGPGPIKVIAEKNKFQYSHLFFATNQPDVFFRKTLSPDPVRQPNTYEFIRPHNGDPKNL